MTSYVPTIHFMIKQHSLADSQTTLIVQVQRNTTIEMMICGRKQQRYLQRQRHLREEDLDQEKRTMRITRSMRSMILKKKKDDDDHPKGGVTEGKTDERIRKTNKQQLNKITFSDTFLK